MRALTELLNGYDQGGIPSFPGLLTFGTASNEHKFRLEDNWRSIVDDPDVSGLSAPSPPTAEEKCLSMGARC